MNAMLIDQHAHEWGPSGVCVHCVARKCTRWKCPAPRVEGASVCEKHLNGRSEVVPRARTVRALTYAWPGARREERLSIAEATR